MKELLALIQPYLVAHTGPGKPLTALADDLERRMGENEKYLKFTVAMLVILFFVELGMVFSFRDQPRILAAVFAAVGIPIFGCVTMMRDLWRQKGASDVLLVIVRHLPASEAKLALQKYVDSLSVPVSSGTTLAKSKARHET